uniref:Uncharacterized protein n=1 Tax=Meiothermus ruber TaxID=277 RepID=A0A7C3I3T3_MEIRU
MTSATQTMTPTQAQSELARLGYQLDPNLECLGAEMRQGQWFFRFCLDRSSGLTIERGQDDLPSLLAKTDWMNRPEPVFDLAQMSFTDAEAWRKLQRLRREDPEEYYRLTHP